MKKAKKNNAVIIAGSILAVIIFACVFCRFFMTKDPTYMDLSGRRLRAGYRRPDER